MLADFCTCGESEFFVLLLSLFISPLSLKRLISEQRANPGVTGAGGGAVAAHVRIFQLWLAMFSLACSALLERVPEKLSVSRNPSLYPDLQHHEKKKKGDSLK